ncbi:DUF6082 family protein [Streptomyces sp. SudanB91_2054]|uniref:DUF6082 family protein n=1 Tax=Streptomyces sp. SudanB91_2054 TaxID=3035278 RepID=UPI0036DCEEAE
MKVSHALLALAAVGAAQLVQNERHQRQQNHVALARIHQDYLTRLTSEPELAKLWVPDDLEVEEYMKLLHCNQQMSALSLRNRLGLMGKGQLRFYASYMMDREIGRRYWDRFGSGREEEGADRADRRFNAAMRDAHTARPETAPAGL